MNDLNKTTMTSIDIIKNKLIEIANEKIIRNDPSHDILHALRVLKNAETICKEEKADLEILIPASIFHDVIVYQKNDTRSKFSSEESALLTVQILKNIDEYPKEKIPMVEYAIKTCSFSKNVRHETIEAKILQDADGLEAIGAIAIMRTFSSAGQMNRIFYNSKDPFCKNRKPDSQIYGLDLFYTRLLQIKKRLYTNTAIKLAEKRIEFLKIFLEQLKYEI